MHDKPYSQLPPSTSVSLVAANIASKPAEIGIMPNGMKPWFYSPPPRLAAALKYAADGDGWYIFPAPPGEKKSYKSAKYSGFKWGITKDEKQIRKDFGKWPDANIGIPTGEENGFFVIEADTVKGHGVDGLASIKELEAEHGPLPKTRMAVSPSGSVHRYYKHPGFKIWSSDSFIAPGVDIKGDGGMVIAPPVSSRASENIAGSMKAR
jgi:hypothetical protein